MSAFERMNRWIVVPVLTIQYMAKSKTTVITEQYYHIWQFYTQQTGHFHLEYRPSYIQRFTTTKEEKSNVQ